MTDDRGPQAVSIEFSGSTHGPVQGYGVQHNYFTTSRGGLPDKERRDRGVRHTFAYLLNTLLRRRRATTRYRAAIIERYGLVVLPFVGDAVLQMRDVYVPLAAETGSKSTDRGDAYQQIRHATRAVVTGGPGSGKSMLLRHSLLAWAERPAPGRALDAPIPVLLDLHRHSDPQLTIERHVHEQLSRDGFGSSRWFVDGALRRGGLTLMLDGLDEVPTARRAHVAAAIKDFIQRYPRNRFIVTCRSAVYEGQLAPEVISTFRVLDFDERLIRQFLGRWPGAAQPGRIDALMEALRDAPQVMQLARNPLLLTMIAYLYATGDDADRRPLPRARSTFYQEATDVLLRRLKTDANQYPGPTKKVVLQQLALRGMDGDSTSGERRAIAHTKALTVVRQLLPDLGMRDIDALPLLTEIVERSGVLLSIDGGDHYLFAHLSLQEFLAARALSDEPQTMLDLYRNDPGRWRESISLWCGITRCDATPIVVAVYEHDAQLGFECVADATVVDATVAAKIVEEMLARLRRGTVDRALIASFARIAADSNPTGRSIFITLVDLAGGGGPAARPAMRALSGTNLPSAAALLAALGETNTDARAALIDMGDTALPFLSDAAARGADWAIDGLREVATPLAIEELVKLLASRLGRYRAAWLLANMMRSPEVEDALLRIDVEAILGKDDRSWRWIWQPFGTPNAKAVAVASRIAALLADEESIEHRPQDLGPLDARIIVPLCTVVLNERHAVPAALRTTRARARRLGLSQSDPLSLVQGDEFVIRLDGSSLAQYPDDARELIYDRALRLGQVTPNFTALLSGVPANIRHGIVLLLAGLPSGSLTRQQWIGATAPQDDRPFLESRHYLRILVTMLACTAFAHGTATYVLFNHRSLEQAIVALVAMSAMFAYAVVLATALVGIWSADKEDARILAVLITLGVPVLSFAFLAALSKLLGITAATAVTWAVLATLAVHLYIGKRRERMTARPLRGLLDAVQSNADATAWSLLRQHSVVTDT